MLPSLSKKPWQKSSKKSESKSMAPSKPKHVQPKLTSDSSHVPKTHGSLGILIIGIGGANGTTLLSGILANRQNVSWYGPHGEGPLEPNYNGCITQLNQRGVHGGVGFRDKIPGLADANMAAIGGWDIRPARLGDALFQGQILDYDLVRQVRDEMNSKYAVFKGYYDPRFIGTSQHEGATHVLTDKEVPNADEALKSIRADIRYFKWKNGVVGHTTVIWSASVEPNCPFCVEGGGLDTASSLLQSISLTEEERGGPLPPSLIYATAAILEGCSFVNGGSQNTLCRGLTELSKQNLGVYCLGTDFKAGQTKFKTAAVEYLRTMGLTPKVIASSNHLGNNDMHNLATGDAARMAKLRVKHDIFAAWEEDIDHKVSVMYTPIINDEKRDFVEYTSLGFLNQTHTMVTYTRASDSVLCVPLMIDVAVWCDFFSRRSWQYENVAKALAYLFKVPEGAAKGVDPGFFRQMQELDTQVLTAAASVMRKKDTSGHDAPVGAAATSGGRKMTAGKRSVRIKEGRMEEKVTEWAIPNNANIITAGLACVDTQLLNATCADGGESIETFVGEKSMGGGSVSMACKTLSRLCHGVPLDEDYMVISPPVVNSVIPLCKVGFDDTGNKLIGLLEASGASCRNVVTKHLKNARERDPNARTALAVLPIYKDGRRGCFFDAASNATFSATDLVEMIDELTPSYSAASLPDGSKDQLLSPDNIESSYGAFLFGYPHLLPMMQGEALAHIFSKARIGMENGGITVLDLNGVPEPTTNSSKATPWGSMCSSSDLASDCVLGPALSHVDILHLNEDELVNLTGAQIKGKGGAFENEDDAAVASAASLFLKCGVAVVAVTRGSKGCYICCNNEERFSSSKMLPSDWIDCAVKVGAALLPPGTPINSNGAGDSFTCGLLIAAMLRHTGLCMQVQVEERITTSTESSQVVEDELDLRAELLDSTVLSEADNSKKLTPYSLYMRENYVALKAECGGNKKDMFSKCHDMWENEAVDVKQMYERKCKEDLESIDEQNASVAKLNDVSQSIKSTKSSETKSDEDMLSRNPSMVNRSMALETAAQFASLVAARHIDMSTRDFLHLDIGKLLEESIVSQHGLEEI